LTETFVSQQAQIARLARIAAGPLTITDHIAEKPEQAAALVVGEIEVFLPLAGLIDMAAERARLSKELEAAEIDVQKRQAKLSNAGFVDKAPAAVVQRERDGLAAVEATVVRLRERIAQLG
jgi:valyl-tRNA synthetase